MAEAETRIARCTCGQARAVCSGEPERVSVCHCLNCKRRSGSSFAVQARFAAANVTITGDFATFELVGDEGGRSVHRFCTGCGATLFYTFDAQPGVLAIPLGLFDDPWFARPAYSVYEERKHDWVEITGPVDHYD
ncbi:GFA family protein [Stakelama sediminis]|uniref:CENP-V/GFA domain-containing protein n=1 Tax=Stakelama sediminis TaxID=463200 RepID=A0A840YUC1_9SPHN|nr:GFA family protein [Stakelama sediminis]MBB5717233.1 hypothetical protein [Stakelama sediminis]